MTELEKIRLISEIYLAAVKLGARSRFGASGLRAILRTAGVRATLAQCQRAVLATGKLPTLRKRRDDPATGLFLSYWGDAPRRWTETYQLPHGPAIYALYDGDEIAYIGESASVSSRLGSGHERLKQIPRDRLRVKIRRAPDDQRARVAEELRLIVRLRPRLNREWRHATA